LIERTEPTKFGRKIARRKSPKRRRKRMITKKLNL